MNCSDRKKLFSIRKHGFDMPEWLWNVVTEGKLRGGHPSNSAYITHAIKEQAKRDKFWKPYQKMLDSQIKKEGSNVA